MIPRVTELESEPEVGKFYMVPCVRTGQGYWVPVMGPPHEDGAIINFPYHHYHRDLRFLSEADVVELANTFAFRLSCTLEEAAMIVPTLTHNHVTAPPVERRMKCRRRMPTFPLTLRPKHVAPWWPKLQSTYADASAKCGRCPHKGFSLKGLPEKDGAVTCPGHGLRWNVETGEMVPRT